MQGNALKCLAAMTEILDSCCLYPEMHLFSALPKVLVSEEEIGVRVRAT